MNCYISLHPVISTSGIFVVFYTVKIVCICVFVIRFTSCWFCDTYGTYVCIYVCMYVRACMYVCMCVRACMCVCMCVRTKYKSVIIKLVAIGTNFYFGSAQRTKTFSSCFKTLAY